MSTKAQTVTDCKTCSSKGRATCFHRSRFEGSPNQIRKQQEQVRAIQFLAQNDCNVQGVEELLWREMNKLAQMCSTIPPISETDEL